MPDPDNKPAVTAPVAPPAAQVPAEPVAAAQPAPAPAPAAPVALDGIAAERARCAAIQAAAQPAFARLAAQAVADGWPADQFIRAQAAAGDAVEAARKEGALGTFRGTLEPPVNAGGDHDQPADPEAKAKADFASDAKLRAEFGNSESRYLAYVRANAAGNIRVISKR